MVEPYVKGVTEGLTGVFSVNGDVHDELDLDVGHLVCLQNLHMVSVHVWIVFLHRHRGYSGNIFRSLMWWLWHVRRRHGTQSR